MRLASVRVGRRRSDRVVDDQRTACLGQGVDVHHLDPEPPREFGRNAFGQLPGDAQANAYAMVPVRRPGFLPTEQSQNHTDRIDDGSPALAYPLPIVTQAEVAIDGRAHACQHGAKHRNGEAASVEQRRYAEMPILRARVQSFAIAHSAADHGEVRQHDALRQSRRPAGVDDDRRIGRPQRYGPIGVSPIEQALERLPSVRRRPADQAAPLGQRSGQSAAHPVQICGINNQKRRRRILDRVPEIISDQTGVDRNPDPARHHHAEPRQHGLVAVAHQTANAVARLQSASLQIAGNVASKRGDLAVGQEPAVDFHTALRGRRRRDAIDELGQRLPADLDFGDFDPFGGLRTFHQRSSFPMRRANPRWIAPGGRFL